MRRDVTRYIGKSVPISNLIILNGGDEYLWQSCQQA
jgi:hypothetical protein